MGNRKQFSLFFFSSFLPTFILLYYSRKEGQKRSKQVCVLIMEWGKGGRHSGEIKLKESKCEEGHIALGVK
jgi:hypothetical protein